MTTSIFRKLPPRILFLIALLFSLHPPGRAASVANATSGAPIEIVYGTDVTLTTMNFFETAFQEDPLNPGLPAPDVQTAISSGDMALAMNAASPGQAGVAIAKIGILYDLLPPPGVSWDDIKDIPLEVIVNFEYTVSAQYTNGQGSANAGLGISPFTTPWYDFLGAETGETGSRTDSVVVSYITTFEALGDKTFFNAYSQAHLTPSGTESTSQADVTVTSIAFDFTPLPPDLTADTIEVTQAVQDLNNSVRLVAGKRTFVRFHAVSNGSTFRTFAHLEITIGSTLHTLYPITPGYYVNVRQTPVRDLTSHAFLFEIPTEFTDAGGLTIVAVLNPENSWRGRDPEELTYDNNTLSTTVTFEDVPTVHLEVHRILYELNGTNHISSVFDATMLPDWIKRALPLSDLKVWQRTTSYPFSASEAGGNLISPSCERINLMLLIKRRWDLTFGSGVGGARYYGMVADSGGFMRGCADLPGPTGSGPSGNPTARFPWDTDGTYADWYGAHELGHSYGRGHANFCGAEEGPPYPYPEGRISPIATGPLALYGFDIKTRAIYNPFWTDIMSYCDFLWISDVTSEGLMTAFQTMPVMAPAHGPADGMGVYEMYSSTPTHYLTISGFVNLQTGMAQMSPVYLLEDVENPLPLIPGDHVIILRGAGGAELAVYPFTPQMYHTGDSNPDNPPEEEQMYLLIDEMVPYVPGTEIIEVANPGGLLFALTSGPATPSVTITSPNGGEILPGDTVTVEWTGSDPDSPVLVYNVQYSPDDGASWETLATGLFSETITISSTNLIASDTALFRVYASDGVHSASDTTDATFTIPNHVPTATIELPETDITVVLSETVGLEGYAYDPETGTMPASMLTWTSNINGLLGNGAQLSLADLSLGVHTITFAADDGDGGVTTDTVIVTVLADPTVAPAPSDQLIAGPGLINLNTVAAPITATLVIENQNLDSSIVWEAMVSESWVSLSASSGTTPDEMIVSFSNTGLQPGMNTATITLTSDDLPGETVVVFVQIFNEEEEGFQLFLPVVTR